MNMSNARSVGRKVDMNLLMDPNVAYLLLVLGFVLAILALFTPGTGILEVGALFAIVLAGLALFNQSLNWWALALILLSAVPFVIALRRGKRWDWALLLGALLMLIVGSIFLVSAKEGSPTIHPVLAVVASLAAGGILWLIARRGMEALRMRPVQDLTRLLSMVGEARTDIDPDGTVYVNGEEWSARSRTPIAAGARVKVTRRNGLVLEVEPAEETNAAG